MNFLDGRCRSGGGGVAVGEGSYGSQSSGDTRHKDPIRHVRARPLLTSHPTNDFTQDQR